MNESQGQPPCEEPEDLEPIEDLVEDLPLDRGAGSRDEIEDLEALAETDSIEGRKDDSQLLTSSFLRDLARSYEKTASTLAILDKGFAFIYQNPLFKTLMRDYGMSTSAPFPSIFDRYIDDGTSRDIRSSLLAPARGYMWKGIIEHKAKDRPSKFTKVNVQPLWPFEEALHQPTAYSLQLDDFTEEKKSYIRDNLQQTLRASLKKERDTGKHVQRVNFYSRRLAEELFRDPRWPEVDVEYIDEIGFLAMLHDVGKIGTPDDILNKKGSLSEAEWKIMQEHTINGAYILAENLNPIAKQIALSHHEWWNGTGYPYNLMGTDIPLAARIVTVADVYDALRMKRSYKSAYTHGVAEAKMLEQSGTHFDPDLLKVFESISVEFGRIFDANQDN